MRVSNYSYANNRVAFGTNKGFLESVEKLKKDIDPFEAEALQAHAQDVVKNHEFMTKVNIILEDEKTPQLLKKLIKKYLGIK